MGFRAFALCGLLCGGTSLGVVSFPGAQGFGALASGGRGASVYHVTNLNDSGPGSFRDAVSQSNRTVVFDVGGVIDINTELPFSNNLTIAGQTAPGGIALYGDGVSLSNRSNIILRYMTIRQGIDSGTDTKALNITTGSNNILDHVSLFWSRYDNLGITANAHDITMQNSISAEGINNQRSGGIVDSSRSLTFARNLFINNQTRNPKGKGDLQYINNVIYNWRYGGYVGGHSSADWYQDLVNNYFIKGRSSENNAFLTDFAATDKIFQSGNMVDLDEIDTGADGLPEGRLVSDSDFTSAGATIMPSAHNVPAVPVNVLSALDAYRDILREAGNSLYRDSADQRQIDDLLSLGSKGGVIADETWVGGMPTIAGGTAPLDTDRDGMPDSWEASHGLQMLDPSDGARIAASGYSNLEIYLNSLVPEPSCGGIAMGALMLLGARCRRVN
jgi:pectate lyase